MKKRRAAPPTDAERDWMRRVKEFGCIVCRVFFGRSRPPVCECHHLTEYGQRRGHGFSIGLCVWHHRGVPFFGKSREDMERLYGPALSNGSRPFRQHFGDWDWLLSKQRELLELENSNSPGVSPP